jgi:hypothetical protein
VKEGEESAANRYPWTFHSWHMSEGFVGAHRDRQAVAGLCTVYPTFHGNSFRGPRVGSGSGTCDPVPAVTVQYLWKWFAYDRWGYMVQLTTTRCPQVMNTDANLSADLLPPDALSSVGWRNLHATTMLSIFTNVVSRSRKSVTSHTTGLVTGTISVQWTAEHWGMLKFVLQVCRVLLWQVGRWRLIEICWYWASFYDRYVSTVYCYNGVMLALFMFIMGLC